MCAAKAKNTIQDLAILGGEPMFSEMLHVGRPNILDPEGLYARIRGAVERKWLSNDGPQVLELEREFAKFLGVKHCVSVANATLGIQLLIEALGIRGKVLMPSFTFIGTAHAVQWQKATPVFCDVLDGGHTLDPQAVRYAMEPGIEAILAVHLWGRACKIEELQAIADAWRVPLIFDAAHALGSSYKGRKIGCFGKAEVFSLHATKAINALEGGLVTTDDDALADKVRSFRNFGFTGREDWAEGPGVNAKMNEFSAAMGLSNLARYDDLLAHNIAVHQAYKQSLEDAGALRFTALDDRDHNHHYAVLEVADDCALSRDQFLDVLLAENIHARRYFWPGCHVTSPYADEHGHRAMPVTDKLSRSLLQLPTGMQLDAGDARAIGALLAYVVDNAAQLRLALDKSKSD